MSGKQSQGINFDHRWCYHDGVHPKTPNGRTWCLKHGPASRWRERQKKEGTKK